MVKVSINTMKIRRLFVFLLLTIGLAGCSDQKNATVVSSSDPAPNLPIIQSERWYTQTQVTRGQELYQMHCAECHKPDASGTTEWRTLDANGKLPPPPLNGTAHTWHHPLSVLRRTVRLGGVPLGGSMPGFSDKLSAEQIDTILAWIQTHWSDEIYRIWHERDTQANTRLQPIKKG
ncbi:hypothetical protein A3197_17125 [Candidatus Thiodiazotropha endoloripes]|nr:hypothetical protein A3197_17125 [Candidatus Thiodiazotropha endoloripes]